MLRNFSLRIRFSLQFLAHQMNFYFILFDRYHRGYIKVTAKGRFLDFFFSMSSFLSFAGTAR